MLAQPERKTIAIAGASGAVGNKLAEIFAEQGHSIVLLFRGDRHAQNLASQFAKYGEACSLVQADLTNTSQVEHGLQAPIKKFGRIDVLVNASGGWLGGKRLHEHSLDDVQAVINMDLLPSFVLMRAVLPAMVKQKSGRIIHFSALSALASGANSAVYAASKTAVLKLVEAAAEEYRADGIQICAIAPSVIDTDNNRNMMPDANHSSWVSMAEIIETVEFLIENNSTLSGSLFKLGGRK